MQFATISFLHHSATFILFCFPMIELQLPQPKETWRDHATTRHELYDNEEGKENERIMEKATLKKQEGSLLLPLLQL